MVVVMCYLVLDSISGVVSIRHFTIKTAKEPRFFFLSDPVRKKGKQMRFSFV